MASVPHFSSDSESKDDLATALAKKDLEEFRVYEDPLERVKRHYTLMRTNQTMGYVQRMEEKFFKFDKAKMTIWEAFDSLDDYVDASDPDTENPNLLHMLQSAEAARKAGEPEWLQLTLLLHDLGKLMYLWGESGDGMQGTADGEQWGLAGDTWVVGCRIPDSTIMPELNTRNPDMTHATYSTENGVYEPGCGLHNLKYAWGHDEYLYRMLVHNGVKLPDEALAMVRFHSCYPLHTGGAYTQFFAPGDDDIVKSVKHFNSYDLYTKSDEKPDVDALRPYYEDLVDKFCPGKLDW